MASFTDKGRVSKRLQRSNNQGTKDPRILGYNPDITISHTSSAPYQLIIVETTSRVELKTVIEYDNIYPRGNVVRVYPQEIVALTPLPDIS